MPETRIVTIVNQRGLHARAAGRFVKLAGGYEANVTVSSQGETVSGLSIMGLLMLGAARGARIEIAADGPEAAAAVDALAGLVETGFGEDVGPPPPRP
ncbi:phosphocarrier protein HPr [Constrictibacter sp. MBR-5]|jgi:phosphocarrier protein|uniref:HPr family phosphocarrier protein n=1 Tax=Constrictibacter sp. MBR-5 TaxID=3156467 RepID=UPI00339990C6